MPDIRVTQPHVLTIHEAKARLAAFEELLSKYKVRLEWEGSRARIAGVPGVGGEVAVGEREVAVHVSLSRMITMMGLDPSRLEQSVRKRLTEAFGG